MLPYRVVYPGVRDIGSIAYAVITNSLAVLYVRTSLPTSRRIVPQFQPVPWYVSYPAPIQHPEQLRDLGLMPP